MAKAPAEIRSLARSHTQTAVKTLVGIMNQSKAPAAARVAAAQAILDRGWGKATQVITGEDGAPLLSGITVSFVKPDSGVSGEA